MEKKYVCISLFNGLGCVWLALDKAGIKVSQKISSEIDKHAIKANDANYPETIQVGDVRKINIIKDKEGRSIKLETEKGIVDLLNDEIIIAGGSPCTDFSFAGKMKGMSTETKVEVLSLEHYLKLKAENFEFEGQSYLFWEYMRILKEINPKYFLLENVVMVKKWRTVLSRSIGINAIGINSALVTAQQRERLYWTNIYNKPTGFFGDMECKIPQPKDKGILLKHILQNNVDEKYYLKESQLKWWKKNQEFQLKKGYSSLDAEKGITQTARQYASWNGNFVSDEGMFQRPHGTNLGGEVAKDGKTPSMTTSAWEHNNLIITKDAECVAMRGRNPDNPNDRTPGAPTEQRLEPRKDGKTNCLTSVQKDNLIREKENYVEWQGNGYDQDNRAYYEDGKSGTLDTKGNRQKVLLKKDKKENKSSREVKQINPSTESGDKQPYQQNRVYDTDGIAPALCKDKSDLLIQGCDYRTDEGLRVRDGGKTGTLQARARNDESCGQLAKINSRIRRLTPVECCRLQNIPDDYFYDKQGKNIISDSQIYRCCGNGWSIDIISHILSYIK